MKQILKSPTISVWFPELANPQRSSRNSVSSVPADLYTLMMSKELEVIFVIWYLSSVTSLSQTKSVLYKVKIPFSLPTLLLCCFQFSISSKLNFPIRGSNQVCYEIFEILLYLPDVAWNYRVVWNMFLLHCYFIHSI